MPLASEIFTSFFGLAFSAVILALSAGKRIGLVSPKGLKSLAACPS
jgi:hypothetical protein